MNSIKHWVIIIKAMGDEILVQGTQAEILALNPRPLQSFPLADLLAGGWTMADIQTPAQVRADASRIVGPYFYPQPIDEYQQLLDYTDAMSGR